MQAELQQQLAEYTAADWEGYRVMQLKVQALVSCNICVTGLAQADPAIHCPLFVENLLQSILFDGDMAWFAVNLLA